jgi:lysozyme
MRKWIRKMKINSEGLALVKHFEGLYLKAYICDGGKITVGYGHTATAMPGMVITKERAEELLAQDMAKFEAGVSNLVRVPLNENQFSALVSFAFNVGLGNLKKSTLLKDLNAGSYDSAANWFGKWVRANGKVLNGLVKRREAETSLFNGKDWRTHV